MRADPGASAPLGEGDEPPLDIVEKDLKQGDMSKTSVSKKETIDDFTQDDMNPKNWTTFDVRHALGRLRHESEAVRLRALRLLHLRWWHCQPTQMRRILSKAGLPRQAST